MSDGESKYVNQTESNEVMQQSQMNNHQKIQNSENYNHQNTNKQNDNDSQLNDSQNFQNSYKNLDDIIDNKIGMGKYQYMLIASVSFSCFIDGIETGLNGLYPGLLKNELNLDGSQVQIIGSSYYFGQFLGFSTSSLFADNLGRKSSLILNTIIMIGANIGVYLNHNYYIYLILRIIYGFLIGNILPITDLVLAEMVPTKFRGRSLIFTGIMHTLGRMYLLIIASHYLDNLQQGDWRSLTIISVYPVILLLIVFCIFCDESPRLLLIQQKFKEAFSVINKMLQKNRGNKNNQKQNNQNENSYIAQSYEEEENQRIIDSIQEQKGFSNQLNEEEKYHLIKWSKQILIKENSKDNRFGSKLKEFLKLYPETTFKLILFSLLFAFLCSTLSFLSPFILHDENKTVIDYLVIESAPLPGTIIIFLLIDYKKINKMKLVSVMFLLQIINFSLLIYLRNDYLLIGMYIANLLHRLPIPICILILMQSYSTVYRAIALSFSTSLSGSISILTPFFIYWVFNIDQYLIFYFIIVMMALNIFNALSFVKLVEKGQQMDDCKKKNDLNLDPNELFNENNLAQ